MAITEDERWIIVDGRRWRATDPAIPEGFRRELVDELMAARREVGRARRIADPVTERVARDGVQQAKVALGERGEPWWEEPSEEGRDERLRATVLTLVAHRAPDRTICPSDAARAIGGTGWRSLMEPTRAVVRDLARADRVEVLQRGQVLDPDLPWRGPVRIRAVPPARSNRTYSRAMDDKEPTEEAQPKKGASNATPVPPKPKKRTPKSTAEVDQAARERARNRSGGDY